MLFIEGGFREGVGDARIRPNKQGKEVRCKALKT